MSTINGISYSSPRNLNVKGVDSAKPSVVRFNQIAGSGVNPLDSSSYGIYVDNNGDLVYSAAGATQTLKRDKTEVVSAANVITAAESGSVFFLNSATEFASTLPAPAAGLHYTFIVTAAPSGANYTITTNSSANIIIGSVHESSGGDGDSETSGADTVNFVDGTAVVGDMAEFWCDGTNWFVKALSDAAGGVTITTAT